MVSRLSLNGDDEKLELDPADPDLSVIAGVLIRVEAQVKLLRDVMEAQGETLSVHGEMLEKIARALGIESSRPVPHIRKELDSLHEEDEKLRKADADTTGKIEAVTKDVAETKLIVKVGLIEGVPKLVKVGGALVAVLGVLAALASQIWNAVHK